MRNVLVACFLFSSLALADEVWKGSPKSQKFQVGAVNGVGVSGNHSGYTLLGSVAYLVHPDGLVDDVTEQMWVELQGGPFIVSGGTGSMFNPTLRWDFTYNDEWVFYGFGGFTIFGRPSTMAGGLEARLHFGVGARYYIHESIFIRGDASYSFLGVGFGIPF